MNARRILVAVALTVGGTAALAATAAPASAGNGCGTVYVKGFNTVEVCNPVIEAAEDLLELS